MKMENEALLMKELEEVKADRKLAQQETERHKNLLAEHIKMQINGISVETIHELSKPIRKKKPMKVKFKDFINKIKILTGFEKHDIR